MSTWEERMAQRSAAKGRTLRQQWERESQQEVDEHAGHHTHLTGTMVQCSCGEDFGVTCVAFPPEWFEMTPEQVEAEINKIRCSACGKPGMVDLP